MSRMRMRPARAFAAMCAVTVVATTGCAKSSKPTSVPKATVTPSTAKATVSAARHVLDEIAPNGDVSRSTALAAFSIAVTPLPGVSVPAGPPGTELFSGTEPVRWLRSYESTLSAEQRKVAKPYLHPSAAAGAAAGLGDGATTAVAVAVARSGAAPASERLADATQAAEQAEIAKMLSLLAAHLGPLGYTPPAVIMPDPQGTAYAQAVRRDEDPSKCDMQFFPKGVALSGVNLDFVVAHELFHCYQDKTDAAAMVGHTGAWWIEGTACWAALAITGAAGPMYDHWNEYLQSPEKSLFSRSYDAFGFFEQIQSAGADPWPLVLKLVSASSDKDRYAFLVADVTPGYQQVAASAFFREPSIGPAWDMTGPGIPSTKTTSYPGIGPGQSVSASAYADAIANVTSHADVTSVRADGYVRVAAESGLDRVVASGATLDLCTKIGGCKCPEGSTGSPPTTAGDTLMHLALTGDANGAQAQVTSHTLDEYCKRAPTTAPAPKGGGGCSLLSPAEIHQLAHIPVTAGVFDGKVCNYETPDFHAGTTIGVNDAIAKAAPVYGGTPVAGLGTVFTRVTPNPLSGGRSALLVVTPGGNLPPFSVSLTSPSATIVADAQALARLVESRL